MAPQDRPSSDRRSEWDRSSDAYSNRRRSRSPSDRRHGDDMRRDRRYGRDAQVSYPASDSYAYDDALRYRQDGRPPLGQRPNRGRDRYEEEDYYAEAVVEDIPYRGEDDVSADGKPMRLLLVRNLKESMSEELFAKGLEKLYLDSAAADEDSHVGASEGSLRRVLIIRDRQTDKSMHFGFAEYHNVNEATAALAKAEALGDKCTISSKVIAVSFPHLTVFPRADFGGQERSEKFTVQMPSTGQMHKYHDDRYYASELMVNEQAPYRDNSPAKDSSEPAEPAASGAVDKPSKKRKAPGTVAPAFLQHWQNKAAELRIEDEKVQAEKEKERAAKAAQAPVSGANAVPAPVQSDQQTFAVDSSKLRCCYLCACQFQTTEGLQRHLKGSAKHAENIASEEACKKGHDRLKKAGVSPDSTIKLLIPVSVPAPASSDPADMSYRDRAAERRKQEVQSGGSKDNSSVPSFSLKGRSTSTPKRSPPTSDTEREPAAPSYGKGMGMLQKAGWSAGRSLGSGGGVTAPLEQSLYASGVGLGHESGKLGDAVEEAQRMTKSDRGGFLEKTKEVARQRFERLG